MIDYLVDIVDFNIDVGIFVSGASRGKVVLNQFKAFFCVFDRNQDRFVLANFQGKRTRSMLNVVVKCVCQRIFSGVRHRIKAGCICVQKSRSNDVCVVRIQFVSQV